MRWGNKKSAPVNRWDAFHTHGLSQCRQFDFNQPIRVGQFGFDTCFASNRSLQVLSIPSAVQTFVASQIGDVNGGFQDFGFVRAQVFNKVSICANTLAVCASASPSGLVGMAGQKMKPLALTASDKRWLVMWRCMLMVKILTIGTLMLAEEHKNG